MRRNPLKILGIMLSFIMAGALLCHAQDAPPVSIMFNMNTDGVDIMTGEKLPDRTLAQRGSFLFYNDRLDKPYDGFWYFFDGRRFQNLDEMVFMRHIKSLGTWIVFNKRQRDDPLTGHPKWHCEIGHHAVSFIPVNAATGKPGKRVHALLEDIHMIQWEESDHWLATDTQEEIEAKAGTIY